MGRFTSFTFRKMIKHLIPVIFLLIMHTANAAIFYIDPENGNISNDGSSSSPWSTLQEVIENNFIQSYAFSPLPYDPEVSQLVIKNQGAPVKGGDTLMLCSGLHGEFFAVNYNNPATVTVMAEDGAMPVIKKIHLQACSNWTFEGITISPEPYGIYLQEKLVFIESHNWQGPSSGIVIRECHIYSALSPWTSPTDWTNKAADGIYITGTRVLVADNLIENIRMGITAAADSITASGNSIINFSGDGMRMLGNHIVFERNLIKNCYDVDENHDDGIQSFTTNGVALTGNIIRSNIIINYENPGQPLRGDLQGIGCFDGFYNDWVIENNLIYVNHWHGISLYGAHNCRIVNNTVLDPTPGTPPGGAWIKIAPLGDGTPSTDNVVKNNVANAFDIDGGMVSDNSVLTTAGEYFINFNNPADFDFHLVNGSSLIDAADDEFSPPDDLDGTPRPQGLHADIGCYEYIFPDWTADAAAPLIFVKIYPNPAASRITVSIAGPGNAYRMSLYDFSGKIIMENIPLAIGENTVVIEKYRINPGIYLMEIFAGGRVLKREKLIIE